MRSFATDEMGRALAGPFPGEQAFAARLGPTVSAPWRGVAPGEVVLTLCPTFTVGGTVTLPDWSHLEYGGEQRLRILTGGDGGCPLPSLRPISEGSWGPLSVPIMAGASYELVLEGSPIVPVRMRFEPPPSGGHAHFDLKAEIGHELWFVAEGEQGQALLEAEIECHYRVDEEEGIIRRRARKDGFLNPWSFPSGARVRSFVTAPGYAGKWAEEVVVPDVTPLTRTVILQKGATVRGRVTHGGRPVEDFDVALWKPALVMPSLVVTEFRDRRDGRFELESAPNGTVLIAASSRSLPQGPTVQVTLPTSEDIELLLPDPLRGHGQVVEQATGTVVVGAKVQVFAATSKGPLRPWGKSASTDHEGRFETSGFTTAGINCIRIEAEGFAPRTAFSAARDTAVDFGRIGLFRAKPLELRLLSEKSCDFESFHASVTGDSVLPSTRFDRNGLLKFEGACAGRCVALIEGPGFPWAALSLELEDDKPWTFTHRLTGGRRLDVELEVPPEVDLSQYLGMYISCVTDRGITTEWGCPIPQDGFFSMEGIDADSAAVAVSTREAGIALQTTSELTESGDLYARLDLGSSEFHLRVLDRAGAPIPGVTVRLTDTSPTPLLLWQTTNEHGESTFRGLPERDVLIHLDHEGLGRAYHRIVDARTGSASVVLDPAASIELVLRDGSEPAPGVRARTLVTPIGPRFTLLGHSDSEGQLLSDAWGQGEYPVWLDHPDYWPKKIVVHASSPANPTEVQIRRRGGILLQFEDEGGVPLAGLHLDLESLEYSTSVRVWLEEGAVVGTLATDVNGQAHVDGLPHGAFSWRCSLSQLGLRTGVCEVPPGRIEPLRIVLR
jgi:hypothetical protein